MEYPVAVSAGAYHQYCLNKDGLVFAWGLASQGGMGIDSDLDISVQEPIAIETLKEATEVSLLKVL